MTIFRQAGGTLSEVDVRADVGVRQFERRTTVGRAAMPSRASVSAEAPVTPRPTSRTHRTRAVSAVCAYVLILLATAGTAVAMSSAGPVVWWSCGGVLAILLLELATIPRYERTRSLRPAKHLAWFGGAFLLLGTIAGKLEPSQVRFAAVVLAVPITGSLLSVLGHRAFRRSRSTLLVGDRVGVGHLVAQWGNHREVEIRGICLVEGAGDEAVDTIMSYPVVGTLANAADCAAELAVDEVVVAPGPVLTAYDVRRMSWALAGSPIELTVAAEVHGAVPHRIEPRLLGKRLLLSVRPGTQPRVARVVKGVIDRAGAAVLLLLLSPVLLALALIVRLDSHGPALFKQVRTGRGGRTFTMYKFRTMIDRAEEMLEDLREHNQGAGPLFKMHDDPRITPVGRFLRKTSLDELPQLFNVLRGDMSLVGPRPGLPTEAEEYDDWIRHRLKVKPGMTGAWQVSGRSNLMWDEGVRLDLDYVDNRTLTGDLVIAAKTVRAVFKQDGAV